MDKDRPHFSKGYTFHFSNGDIGLVLNMVENLLNDIKDKLLSGSIQVTIDIWK